MKFGLRTKLSEAKKILAPIIVIALAVLAFVQLYFSYFVFRQTNDECLWLPVAVKNDTVRIIFTDVKPGGVTWEAGIRDGDTLLAVEGEEIYSVSQLAKKLSRKKAGEKAFYQFKRGDSLFVAAVTVKKLLPVRSLALELFALIWLIVGFIVYSSKPEGEVQNKFFNLGILWVITNNYIFVNSAQYIPEVNASLIEFLNWTWVIAVAFLPVSIIDFFAIFPQKRKIVEKKGYGIFIRFYPILILASYLLLKVFFKFPDSVRDFTNIRELIIYGFSNLIVIIALVTGFVSFYLSYKGIKDEKRKRPFRIILYAYAISLLSLFYVNFLARVFVGSFYNHPHYYLPVFLFVLLPVAFAYTIFKYSFMDASSVVKNAFLYFIASLFIAGVYFFSIVIIGGSFINAVDPTYQGLIIGLLFVMFVILFQSTKDKFQEAITKRFYPEQLAFKEVLIRFSREITLATSFDAVLDETSKIFVDALKIRVFALGIFDEKEEKIEIKKSSGIKNKEKLEQNINLNECKRLIANKELNAELCLELENFDNIFSDVNAFAENEIQTALPLIVRDKLIGFVFLGVKHSGARFSKEDVKVLSAAASQVATALENARLYEAEKRELILKRDLENARKIQQGLLPKTLPKFGNAEILGDMLPAQWVGGDYYDVIPLDEKRFYAVVGDVSGKGFSAAFYMSKLQTMIRLLADEKLTPAEMLKTINKKIYSSLEKNYFITLSTVLFDFEKKLAFFARAGHTPLKVFEKGKVKDFLPKGIAVGLDKGEIFDANIEQVEIPLNSGAVFVLFSDGVTEAMNSKNELLGGEFIDLLLKKNEGNSLKTILDDLIGKIKDFEEGKEQHDDITFLLVKINS